MRIDCRCEHCSKKLRATEDMLGKKAKCPGCGAVTVLRAAEVPAPAPVETTPSPVQAKPAPAKGPRAYEEPPYDEGAFDEVEEDYADEPPMKQGPKAKPASQAILLTYVVWMGLMGTVSAGIGAYTFQEKFSRPGDAAEMEKARAVAAIMPKFKAEFDKLEGQKLSMPYLYAAAGAGVVGTVLAVCGFGLIGGVVLLAAPVAPTIFSPLTLVFTGFLALAGLMSFFIRSRAAAQAAADKRADAGLPPARRGALGILGAVFLGLVLAGYTTFVGLVLYKIVTENLLAPKGPRVLQRGPDEAIRLATASRLVLAASRRC